MYEVFRFVFVDQEVVGIVSCNAGYHQGAIKMLWKAVTTRVFVYCSFYFERSHRKTLTWR